MGHNLTELCASEDVDRGYFSHTDWLAHAMRYLRVKDHMVRAKTKTLLDVGCGKLQLQHFLYRNRMTPIDLCTAIDLRAQEKWLLDYAWRTPLHLVQMDIVQDDPTFGDSGPFKPFDLVTCLEMLEHIPRPMVPTLLQRLHDWTDRDGWCILSTPNRSPDDFSSVAENHVGPDGIIREWWFDDLALEITNAGFHVVTAAGTFMKTLRIPKNSIHQDALDIMHRRLPYAMYSVAAASLFPRESTNVIWALRRTDATTKA